MNAARCRMRGWPSHRSGSLGIARRRTCDQTVSDSSRRCRSPADPRGPMRSIRGLVGPPSLGGQDWGAAGTSCLYTAAKVPWASISAGKTPTKSAAKPAMRAA